MPGFLVNLSTTVTCVHQGPAKPTMTAANVLVMGQPVAIQTSPYVVTLCTLPPPPTANGPCATATWFSGATRILVNGTPVLLQDSQALCVPSGTPLLITANQMRVSGM